MPRIHHSIFGGKSFISTVEKTKMLLWFDKGD